MAALLESKTVTRHPSLNRHSGSIRVTWAECPNRSCASRNFGEWNVDYEGDSFFCGTCETPLERPLFFPHIAGTLCPDCHAKFQGPSQIVKPHGEVT